MKAFWITCLFLSFGIFCSAQTTDPSIEWRSLETPHFVVIFDSKQQQLAEQYARFAEQAFTAATPLFGVWPEKTVLVLNDSVDFANGFATGVPYPLINLNTALPTALDSVSDYGNWGLELVTHEYTHILNFEPATGVVRPFRWIFGSIVRPNILLPRWYSEGLAVELETRLSRYGRLRSANYLSVVRSMSEEGTLLGENISRINETSIPDWPGGIRPYLMGALIWDEMIRLGGDKIIGDLNTTYSRRLPYFINGPVEDRFGLDYPAILAKSYARVEASAKRQIEAVKSSGTSPERRLEQRGYFSHSPAFSPDGRLLAFIAKEHNVDSYVALVERPALGSIDEGTPKRIVDGKSINRLSWFPDSKALVYDSVDTFKRYNERSDLWRLDVEARKSTQLTKGQRAREPVVSPDGRAIVFSRILPGSTELTVVKADGSEARALYTPPLQTRISRPEFLDRETLVFTEKRDDGAEVLKEVKVSWDAEGLPRLIGEPRTALNGFSPVHFPKATAEGLLFVSDRTGIANIYLADRQLKSVRPITNTTTRAMTGDLDPQSGKLVFSRLTSGGPRIHSIAKEDWSKQNDPPKVTPLVESQWPNHTPPEVTVQAETEDYNPFPYLIPRYWMPYAFIAPEGLFVQASTANADPVNRHAYSLGVSYDTQSQLPSFVGSYTNRTTPVALTIAGQDVNEYIYSGNFVRHSVSGLLAGTFFLPRLSNSWAGILGVGYHSTTIFSRDFSRGGVHAGFSWSSASRRGLEISPEKGGSFRTTYTQFLPGWGNSNYGLVDLSGSRYFSKWLPERHALALSANVSYAPNLNEIFAGQSTVGGTYENAVVQNNLIMRGYGSGAFVGRSLAKATAEYRFPLSYMYKGFGTYPFFIQRLHADVFVDALTLDGVSLDASERRYRYQQLGRFFYGTGAEVKADATIFFHLQIQFIFGLYYGLDREVNPHGLYPFFGIGL